MSEFGPFIEATGRNDLASLSVKSDPFLDWIGWSIGDDAGFPGPFKYDIQDRTSDTSEVTLRLDGSEVYDQREQAVVRMAETAIVMTKDQLLNRGEYGLRSWSYRMRRVWNCGGQTIPLDDLRIVTKNIDIQCKEYWGLKPDPEDVALVCHEQFLELQGLTDRDVRADTSIGRVFHPESVRPNDAFVLVRVVKDKRFIEGKFHSQEQGAIVDGGRFALSFVNGTEHDVRMRLSLTWRFKSPWLQYMFTNLGIPE